MTENYVMVNTTFADKDEAKRIINILLTKRLVSCVQLSNIESHYHWKGKILHADEILAVMKSTDKLFKQIVAIIEANHSYETPQIIALPIIMGSEVYLSWISNETKGESV